jgi:hypothetical protein
MRHLLLPFLMCLSLQAQDPTAEAILSKHLAARGGVARLKAVDSIRITGVQVLTPSPIEIPMVIEQRRPNLQRVEMNVKGMVEVQTFDGTEGWIRTPWAANKSARPMEPEEIKALTEHDFDTPYLNWKEKGWKAEYLGTVAVEGRTLQKVQVTVSNTESIIGIFDGQTFQEVQRENVYRELGNQVKLMSLFSDYRLVQGMSFPFNTLIRAEYRGRRFKFLVDRVDVNPKLDDQRFAKP